MTKSIIKYVRVNEDTLILVPAKEGVERVGKAVASISFDPNTNIPLIKDEEEIGGVKVICFKLQCRHKIDFFRMDYNTRVNSQRFEVNDMGFVRYYLTVPVYV